MLLIWSDPCLPTQGHLSLPAYSGSFPSCLCCKQYYSHVPAIECLVVLLVELKPCRTESCQLLKLPLVCFLTLCIPCVLSLPVTLPLFSALVFGLWLFLHAADMSNIQQSLSLQGLFAHFCRSQRTLPCCMPRTASG